MSQTTQSDLIGITDVAAKIPQFIGKLPHLVTENFRIWLQG